jgi:L-ascorbate metabolism protein UlaG (beta-lactamase superfamily)
MRIVRLDDYQTWYLQVGESRILVDPWLTPTMAFPMGMFHRTHTLVGHESLAPTHLIVTAPFGDHLHAPSLQLLDKSLPVMTTPAAAKHVRKLGFTQVIDSKAGDTHVLSSGVTLRFVAPGFPYASNSLGFLLEETHGDRVTRAYLETHVVSKATLESLPKPIDALLTTAENVRMFGIQLAMDVRRAGRVAAALQVRHFLPTGVNPGKSTGMLPKMLFIRSDKAAMAQSLAEASPSTEIHWLEPGEGITLDSEAPPAAEISAKLAQAR